MHGVATTLGLHAPSLYAFSDPNCPCRARLWSSNIGNRSFPDLPAIWIPVAYLDKSSPGKTATLLRGARKEWLAANFSGFDDDRRSGAILPSEPNSTERRNFDRALIVWEKRGPGTPLVVWRATDGRVFSLFGFQGEERLGDLLSDLAPSRLQDY